ncbi:MAG: chemotaxis protein CheW, partial [Magnetococcales bacterium]|nr:chemotaxis protein CheW [Magnetococcales bacterium]
MQLLTFHLGEGVYALEIFHVREVLSYSALTRVPRSERDVRGVINLRGAVIPVADLRVKLNMAPAQLTRESCIIIIEVARGEDKNAWGLLVDGVREVTDVEPAEVELPPKGGGSEAESFIAGMVKRDRRFILMLDALLLTLPPEERARELAQRKETAQRKAAPSPFAKEGREASSAPVPSPVAAPAPPPSAAAPPSEMGEGTTWGLFDADFAPPPQPTENPARDDDELAQPEGEGAWRPFEEADAWTPENALP